MSDYIAPILFLDFDGVLHPDPDPDWPERTKCLSCLPILEEALRGLDFRVVITSSWRSWYSLDEFRTMLGEIGPRVVGVTTYMSHMPLSQNKGRAIRQAEVLRWLELFDEEEGSPYLVLDDAQYGFQPGWFPLYITDGKTGLRPEDIKPIRVRMERLQG
jgi:hypothetical protein